MSPGAKIKTVRDRPLSGYLLFTTAICGAMVMIIEVVGSRVLGPLFGISLFIWTSLIAVTLTALAAGYAAGGILSDKRGTPDILYVLVLVAGLLVLFIPLMKPIVLKMCLPLGLRAGALMSSFLLFAPPIFLLGCVSPIIIKIVAREPRTLGRIVGIFYALSTVGSFLGTVLTGFVLIAYLEVNRIFHVIGLSLIFISVFYFLFLDRKFGFAFWAVVLAMFGVAARIDLPVSKMQPNGTTVTLIYSKDSFYGNLKVVDYSKGSAHTRELLIDGMIQGGIDMNNGMSVYPYTYFLEFLPYGMNPNGRNCLVIGLGPAVVPIWYEQAGVRTDVVEIDPNIPRIAQEYFSFHISGDVIIADARYHIANSRKKYDYVILDAFSGDTTPGHLLSIEAMRSLKNRMTGNGILGINLAGSIKRENFMTASVVKTLGSIFRIVEIYPNFSLDGEGWGNLTIIAHDRPGVTFDPERVRRFQIHPLARPAAAYLTTTYNFPTNTPAIIMSDNYNPLDFFDIWLKENARKNLLANTDIDILIH